MSGSLQCSTHIVFYIIKSTYEGGKRSSKVVERLGRLEDIARAHPGTDPRKWAAERAHKLTEDERKDSRKVLVPYSTGKQTAKGEARLFEGGYLFLQCFSSRGIPQNQPR
jgi:hypothetical protein